MTKYGNLKQVAAQWPTHRNLKIALVGEAPGQQEAYEGRPFVGASGRLLNSCLESAGIDRADCLVTNVFTWKPLKNNIAQYFTGSSTIKKWKESGWNDEDFIERPSFPKGANGYLRADKEWELYRLREELELAAPNVVVALGATALWALTGVYRITKYRGTVMPCSLVEGLKVVATFHPAYVMRQWSVRPTVGADLLKARLESEYPEIRRPSREVWIKPTIKDLYDFEDKYMQNVEVLAYDIETDPWDTKLLRCVGIAPDPYHAIVLPFFDKEHPGWSYWPTLGEELWAWLWLKKWLENPDIAKLAHNCMYDIQWLARDGIKVKGKLLDTMLMHHALQPELPKALGGLASIYTNEGAWKNLVDFKQHKKDA